MTGETEVGFSFGSNIGDKAAHIRAAIAALGRDGLVTHIVGSSLYRTAPWGHVTEQDWFVNACICGSTRLAPTELLAACKTIEQQLGRTETVRWGPRVIDIDILFYGDAELHVPGLTIPHKEMLRRAFVLVPLAEIRPDKLIHGQRVKDAAAALAPTDVLLLPEHPTP